MSIAAWYVIVTKALQLISYRRASHAVGHAFWDTTNLAEGVVTLGTNNPFSDIAQAGITAMRHHAAHKGHLHDQLLVSAWVTLSLRQAIDDTSGKLQPGMAGLPRHGSTAPFVAPTGAGGGV